MVISFYNLKLGKNSRIINCCCYLANASGNGRNDFAVFDNSGIFITVCGCLRSEKLIHIEYIASPHLTGKTLIISDPMLATGSSMELAYEALLTKGVPGHVHVASIISSKQALEYLQKKMPDDKTTIWIAALDNDLDDHSYIVPGLGDAGDLAFGEKE